MKAIYQNTDVFPDQGGSLLCSCFSSLPAAQSLWQMALRAPRGGARAAQGSRPINCSWGSGIPCATWATAHACWGRGALGTECEPSSDTGHITPLSPSSFLPGVPTLPPVPPALWVSSCFSGHFFIFFLVDCCCFHSFLALLVFSKIPFMHLPFLFIFCR